MTAVELARWRRRQEHRQASPPAVAAVQVETGAGVLRGWFNRRSSQLCRRPSWTSSEPTSALPPACRFCSVSCALVLVRKRAAGEQRNLLFFIYCNYFWWQIRVLQAQLAELQSVRPGRVRRLHSFPFVLPAPVSPRRETLCNALRCDVLQCVYERRGPVLFASDVDASKLRALYQSAFSLARALFLADPLHCGFLFETRALGPAEQLESKKQQATALERTLQRPHR
jgi:hypothetical protein